MAAKITVRLAQGAALIDCMRRCHRTRIPNALHRPLFSTRTSDRCVIARAAAEASGEIKPYRPTTIGGYCPGTAGIPACWAGEKSMKKKGRRQPFYPAPPFFKTFVPKSHVFKNSLPRASLVHRLFSHQESGNACRVRCASYLIQLTQTFMKLDEAC